MEILLLLFLLQGYSDNTALSHIALCHDTWRCARTIESFRDLPEIRLGFLGGPTFGENCGCLRNVLQVNKPKVLRVHIANGPCLRNRRCGSYEIFHGDTRFHFDLKVQQRHRKTLQKFDRYLLKLKGALKRANGKVTCFVSSVLESDFSAPARRVLLKRVKAILPQCAPVDSVFNRRCLDGVICEKHGIAPKLNYPCIADNDGTIMRKADKPRFLHASRNCHLAFIWRPSFNCLDLSSPTFIDPRNRICHG